MNQSLLFQPAIRASTADAWAGLRFYQVEACEAIVAGFDEYRSQLLVLATGGGKTQVFCALARQWKGKVLVLAHRDELVEQARARLEQMTGEQVDVEQAGRQASIFSRLVVASVDTIKQQKRLDRFGKDHFGLIVADECFPAGTLVDGMPIERVAVGDIVSCVDHATGHLAFRKVTHRFERMAPSTVTLYTGATSLECTGNHPVYIKRGESVGYVQAEKVVSGDLLCMFRPLRADDCDRVSGAADVLEQVSVFDLLSDDGGDQPPLRIKTDDGAQSDAHGDRTSKNVGHASGNEAWATSAPGEWSWAYGCRTSDRESSRMGDQRGRVHWDASWLGVSAGLQAGRGEPGAHDGNRGRRDESLRTGQAGPGCKEGEVLAWVRVDRVARNEPTGPGGTRVYNLEIEGCHTYFANDTLVHNCHHFLAATYRRPLDYFSGAKLLGVTATPDRGDEKAMGKLFENVAYCFDIRQGIDQGYLVPLVGRQIELGEIELDGVATVAGDLSKGQLDEVMLRAVEGIVKKTIELEPDRQAVCFFPGVKSAEYATERFNALEPMSAAFVSGETLPHIRKGIVADFRAGRIKRLCNCMVATEGFDAPSASCIVQARPTKSRGLYAQMVGRGTRVLGGLVEAIPGREGADERRALIASSLKKDCIAEGQLVLTDAGMVPIEQVTLAMKVWDGRSFVSHGGAILRGESEVIHYAGLTATADHCVWTQEGWKTLGECAAEQIRIAVTGAGIACLQQSSGYYRGDCSREDSPARTDGMYEVRRAGVARPSQSGEREGGLPRMRKPEAGPQVARASLFGGEGALLEPEASALRRLRGSRDSLRVPVTNRDGCVGADQSRTAQESPTGPNRQREGLCAWEPAALQREPEPIPYAQAADSGEVARVPSEAPGGTVCRRHTDGTYRQEGADVRADSGAVLQPAIVETKRRVWDILDAGPFHRFTVEGLLVHNCVILDFVGNATKHALMTPEDLLGGDYSDEEVDLAKKKAKQSDGTNPITALEEARKELQRVAMAIRSKVQAQARMFDPFAVLDIDITSTTREDMRWGRQPPTERQLEALARMKLPKEALKNISQREARKLLAERSRRHDAGLATYAQLGHLKKYGVSDQNISFEAAGRALTYIASVGWKEQRVDRLVLGAMIGGTTTDRAFGASK